MHRDQVGDKMENMRLNSQISASAANRFMMSAEGYDWYCCSLEADPRASSYGGRGRCPDSSGSESPATSGSPQRFLCNLMIG